VKEKIPFPAGMRPVDFYGMSEQFFIVSGPGCPARFSATDNFFFTGAARWCKKSVMVASKNDFIEYSELLKAISNPARLQILEGLRLGDKCNVSRIQKRLNLPQSTVSQHLSVMRNRGIIRGEREGVKMCYTITDKRVLTILDALNQE